MPASDTLIDQVFDNRYRVVRKLGAGGMANVYLAEDQELGRRVAIKILNERHANDDQFVERFRREAKNAAGLSHPNIVSIYDRGEADGSYYIAMEYLEGRTLKELILTRGPSPIPVALDYTRQILAAIGHAHRNGIVHRDIKPHNVIVAPDGRVKVTDFGIARSGASQMTEAGSIIGTAQYLSPEQARGGPVDQRSDLYSVGIVLYEMLTGVVPFSGDTPLEIAMKHLSTVPDPPSHKRDEVPHDVDLVVLRALAKDAQDRFQSAEEFDAELARVARGLAVTSETADAATAVLSGAGIATAPTAISRAPTREMGGPPAPPRRYYEYEEAIPQRRLWPWLLALLLLLAAAAAGWYVYTRVADELGSSRTVAVPLVEGIRQLQAEQKLRDADLVPSVSREPNENVDPGYVFDQSPDPGLRIDKGSSVTIVVSTGKPRTLVPDVRGKNVADAVGSLADAKLKARVVEINSEKPTNSVIAQDPKPGTRLVEGSAVRLNVSKGPKPIAVPPVVGQPYEQAIAELQAKGFAVARRDVDADDPKGTVVGMDPSANTLHPRGTTITLSVSRGPTTAAVPDVTSLDRDSALQTLRNSGFRPVVEQVETSDPSQDGIVLNQDPGGGTEAEPKTRVTIFVGRFIEPAPEETEPTETEPATTTTVP